MLKNDWEFHRGDIYYANLNPFFGSEQGDALLRTSVYAI
jgi:mRNA-degrading endonuclease toxin of MazEF toxin-antitoxin module